MLGFLSLRRLFSSLPAENLYINYTLSVGGFTVLHSIILLITVVGQGGLEGTEVFSGLGIVSLVTGLITWTMAVFIFPRIGVWNPEKVDDELDGRIALGLGLIWYMVATGVGLFLLMVTLIAFFFPG